MLCLNDYADLVAPPDAVLIHLAETRSIALADGASEKYIEAATQLVRTLLKQPWKHFIYVSSAAVYDDRSSAAHIPGEQLNPLSIYGRSKLACESLVLAAGGTVVRATNLIGPRMAPDNVLADILGQLTNSGPLVLRALTPVRDYLWVDDIAILLVLAAEQQKSGVFNAASGQAVSVAELAKLVLVKAKQSDRPLVETCPVGYTSTIKLDIASTIQAFDWIPQTSLEAAVQDLVNINKQTTT